MNLLCSPLAPERMKADIALVKLSHSVMLNTMVNIACLPVKDDFVRVGTECVTAGWGHTQEGEVLTCSS